MPRSSIWTKIKIKWQGFVNAMSYKQKVALTTVSGIAAGLLILFMYLLRMHTKRYLQPIITQYFIDNKSEIWLLFLIAHSKR